MCRASLYGQVLKRVNDATTDIWLYDKARVDALKTTIRGHQGNAWMPATYDIDGWWVAR